MRYYGIVIVVSRIVITLSYDVKVIRLVGYDTTNDSSVQSNFLG